MKKALSLVLCLSLCFFLSTCVFTSREPPDYLAQMAAAARTGDLEAGRAAARTRSAWIDKTGSEEAKISFDDLYLLSRYIYARAGSFRYSDEYRMCVGQLVLNRVASPDFPDNLLDVVLDDSLNTGPVPTVAATRGPNAPCVEAALRLLLGERLMDPDVLYQSDTRPQEVYASFGDKLLGFTYFSKTPAD